MKNKPIAPPLPEDPAYREQLKRVIEIGRQKNSTLGGRARSFRAQIDRMIKEHIQETYLDVTGRHDPRKGRVRLTSPTGGDNRPRMLPPRDKKPLQAPRQLGRLREDVFGPSLEQISRVIDRLVEVSLNTSGGAAGYRTANTGSNPTPASGGQVPKSAGGGERLGSAKNLATLSGGAPAGNTRSAAAPPPGGVTISNNAGRGPVIATGNMAAKGTVLGGGFGTKGSDTNRFSGSRASGSKPMGTPSGGTGNITGTVPKGAAAGGENVTPGQHTAQQNSRPGGPVGASTYSKGGNVTGTQPQGAKGPPPVGGGSKTVANKQDLNPGNISQAQRQAGSNIMHNQASRTFGGNSQRERAFAAGTGASMGGGYSGSSRTTSFGASVGGSFAGGRGNIRAGFGASSSSYSASGGGMSQRGSRSGWSGW